MGLAVVDIQKLFLAGKEVGSTIQGKMFTVKKMNESLYQASMEKVVLDLQSNESYFKDYESFAAIFADQFKGKTGFQESTDLTKEQVEQLFNKDLALRVNSESARTSAETFVLADFITSMRVGGKVSVGRVTGTYLPLKTHFSVGGADTRYTAIQKDRQVTVSAFGSSGITNGYSYSYSLPASVPLYAAPVWFWEKLNVSGAPNPFLEIPADARTSGLSVNNFGSAQNSMTVSNGKVVGTSLELEYPADVSASSSVFLNEVVDVSRGFETSFEFSGESGAVLELQLMNKDKRSLTFYGIHSPYGARIGPPMSSVLVKKATGDLFDGRDHKVKIVFANRSSGGAQARVFVDDMEQPIYDALFSLSPDLHSYFTLSSPDAERYIGLSAWPDWVDVERGKMTIKNWTFKSL